MDSFMSNQMNEVEGGSQIQKAVVVEEPKNEIKQSAPQVVAQTQAQKETDGFGDALADYLTNGKSDPKMG